MQITGKTPEVFLTDGVRDSFFFVLQYNSLLISNYLYLTIDPLPSLFLCLLRAIFALCLDDAGAVCRIVK